MSISSTTRLSSFSWKLVPSVWRQCVVRQTEFLGYIIWDKGCNNTPFFLKCMIRLAILKYFRPKFRDARFDINKLGRSSIVLIVQLHMLLINIVLFSQIWLLMGRLLPNISISFFFFRCVERQHPEFCTLQQRVLGSAYLPFLIENDLKSLLRYLKPPKNILRSMASHDDLHRNYEVIKRFCSLFNTLFWFVATLVCFLTRER